MANQLRGVGRYEILREIGHGGTAIVYLAEQTDLGRLVALKELSVLSAADPSAARRFVRESRLAGSLNDPNIVTVHDFFEDHGTPYIAMEYLERGSLRPLMDGLTFAQIAGVLESLLAGLGHAQERSIVHRDLKPENLLVTTNGRVKIADFGIAKATGDAQAATMLTAAGTTIGTPTYMAPEQAMAGDIGPWTDLYAVGVIAFELFAGRPPFETTGAPMAILLQHVNTPPPELTSVDPSVDPRLSEWIARLLVKEPEDRPHTATGVWSAFEEMVLDRLGPRWRRAAGLFEVAPAAPTPATMPMAPRGDVDQREIATAMPLSAPPTAPTVRRKARTGGGASSGRVVRALLFLVAFVVVVVAAFGLGSGNGNNPSGGANGVRTAPAAAPTAGPTSAPGSAPAAAPTATPRAAPTADPADVGDSQSDDPSDDEPDVGEP